MSRNSAARNSNRGSSGLLSTITQRLSGRGDSKGKYEQALESEDLLLEEESCPQPRTFRLRPVNPKPGDAAEYLLDISVQALELRPVDATADVMKPGTIIQFNWIRGVQRTPDQILFDWRFAEDGEEFKTSFYTYEAEVLKAHFFACVNWIVQQRNRVAKPVLNL